MNEARSIKQNHLPDALPSFRNLGVTLRILLLGNGLALVVSVLQASGWADVLQQMMQVATLLTPILLSCLLLLWCAQPWLSRFAYRRGLLIVNVMVGVLTLLIYFFGGEIYSTGVSGESCFNVLRGVFL